MVRQGAGLGVPTRPWKAALPGSASAFTIAEDAFTIFQLRCDLALHYYLGSNCLGTKHTGTRGTGLMKPKFAWTIPCLTVACLLVIATVPSMAQLQSRLTGTVTDPGKGVVSGAKVEATNMSTRVTHSATTGETGTYVFPVLPVGEYEVRCQFSGFKRVQRAGVVLETGIVRNVDITLEVGAVSETVEVKADRPLLESESSTVGQLIERAAVLNLPLESRRSGSLVRLVGNVSFIREADFDQIPLFSLAGGRGRNQAWWLDGAIVQNTKHANPTLTINPPSEALQEFKVEINNYSAEIGRTGGGVIMMTTRAGTNQFRGALYEFFRNDKLDARSFFAPRKPPLRYNIFGGSIGGPVIRSKTFFFFNYETARRRDSGTVTYTTPHSPELSGDFSGRRDITVLDPLTNTPFQNNIIPASRIDPVGRQFAQLYPAPTIPTNDVTRAPVNNFISGVSDKLTQNFYTTRLDHNFSENNRIYARYSFVKATPRTVGVFANDFADPRASGVNSPQHSGSLSWIHNHSPHLLSEVRVVYFLRDTYVQHLGFGSGKNGEFGLRGVNPDALARVDVTGITSIGSLGQLEVEKPQSIGIPYSATWIKSGHQIRSGFEYRYYNLNSLRRNLTGGRFNFTDRATRNGLASLLLGWTTDAGTQDSEPIVMRGDYYAAYIGDDWKVTPSLTLNIGLRWELDVPYWESTNRQSGFASSPINPVSGTPGIVTFAGRDGRGKYAHDFDKNDYAPRFGFAYRAPLGLVFRGGYGFHYTPHYGANRPRMIHGFGNNQTFESLDGGFTPAFLFRNGMPPLPPQQELGPGFGAVRVGQVPRLAPEFLLQNHKTGYMQQWNFGIQKQLGGDMVVEVAYLGNVGHKLGSTREINVNMIPLTNGRGPAVQDQRLRPYAQFSNVLLQTPPMGNSSYNALNVKVEKRYSNGLNFLMNYTWSKFLDNSESAAEIGGPTGDFGSGYTHIELLRLDKSLSGADIGRRYIGSVVYDLPFGKGRRFGIQNSILEKIAGGWTMGVITELRDGAPYGVTEQTNRTNTFSHSQRPNLLKDPTLDDSRARSERIARYFDTAAFAAPGDGVFGDAPRHLCCLPGFFSMDVSAQKRITLNEDFSLSFRTDMFNLPNRPNFGSPNLQRGNAAFGRISGAGGARLIQFNLRLEF